MKKLATRFGVVPFMFVFGVLFGSVLTGTALAAYQPHMYNAMHSLQNAQYELNQAQSDKAGHRVQALHLIAQAIDQVRWGIQAANQGR
jgi:hypothetical protein